MKELFFLVTSALQALLESQMSMTRNYFEPVLCRWRPWQPSNDVKEAEDFMAHYWSQSDNNRQDGKPRKIRRIIFFWHNMLMPNVKRNTQCMDHQAILLYKWCQKQRKSDEYSTSETNSWNENFRARSSWRFLWIRKLLSAKFAN